MGPRVVFARLPLGISTNKALNNNYNNEVQARRIELSFRIEKSEIL